MAAQQTNVLGNYDKGGSIFWILTIFFALMGLAFIMLWSFQETNNNLQAFGVALIMALFIVIGLLVSKFEIFNNGSWTQNCISFFIAFWTFFTVNVLFFTGSIFSVISNSRFSTITSQMPLPLQYVTDVFLIPIGEEMLWIVGIPFTVIWICDILSKQKGFAFLKNKMIQLLIMITIGASTFAAFHVGKVSSVGFIFAAVMFRTALLVLVYGNGRAQHPLIRLSAAAAIGAHIGNNWADFGLVPGFQILIDNFTSMGFIVFGMLSLIFGTVLWLAYQRFIKGKNEIRAVRT